MTHPVTITRDGSKLILPWHAGLASMIPHAKPLDFNGERLLVMPNADIEARLARNLGMAVPPPILTAYDWAGTKPWAIQRTTAAMLVENPRLFCLNTMGTGKSLSALYACDYLMKTGQAKKVLVTAPLSTLTPVWEAEVFRFMPHRRVSLVHGSVKDRRKALAKPADFYVINHHGLDVITDELAAMGFDIGVVDELAVFRNRSTNLWKAANKILEKITWVWGLTGSPTPMAPTDAWAQVKLLSPGRVPRSMTGFRTMTMNQVSQFRWVPKPDATSIVHSVMQPAVRFTREDVMELPPTTYVDRKVELDPLVDKAYRMMHDRLRMGSEQGQPITAANEGVLHSKLLQIAMGWVYTDDKTIYELPSQKRLEALDEIILETDRKVIVFVPFVHALQGVTDFLAKKGHKTALIHGGVPRHARDKIFTDFQHGPEPRVLIAHPKTMAHGLTLTSANTIIWYGALADLETYEQANARITRPSQTAKTYIVHLHGGTQVERLTYRRLKERGKMQGILLEMFRGQSSVL